MSRLRVTLTVEVIDAKLWDPDGMDWSVTETRNGRIGNPAFIDSDVEGLAGKLVARVREQVRERFKLEPRPDQDVNR